VVAKEVQVRRSGNKPSVYEGWKGKGRGVRKKKKKVKDVSERWKGTQTH